MQALGLEDMPGLVPVILGYVPLTIGMAMVAMVGALVLASLMAVERVVRVPVLDQSVQLFISFFRGTPLLVQLFLFYCGLPQILPVLAGINGVTATIIGLTLHFAALMAAWLCGAPENVDDQASLRHSRQPDHSRCN